MNNSELHIDITAVSDFFGQVPSHAGFRNKSPLFANANTTPRPLVHKKHCILHGFGGFVRGDRPTNVKS